MATLEHMEEEGKGDFGDTDAGFREQFILGTECYRIKCKKKNLIGLYNKSLRKQLARNQKSKMELFLEVQVDILEGVVQALKRCVHFVKGW